MKIIGGPKKIGEVSDGMAREAARATRGELGNPLEYGYGAIVQYNRPPLPDLGPPTAG